MEPLAPPNPELGRMFAVSLPVIDLVDTEAFYVKVLNFAPGERSRDGTTSTFTVENTMIQLREDPKSLRGGNLSGFKLLVLVPDLAPILKALAIHHVPKEQKEESGVKSIRFIDPDGHRWELTELLPESDTEKH